MNDDKSWCMMINDGEWWWMMMNDDELNKSQKLMHDAWRMMDMKKTILYNRGTGTLEASHFIPQMLLSELCHCFSQSSEMWSSSIALASLSMAHFVQVTLAPNQHCSTRFHLLVGCSSASLLDNLQGDHTISLGGGSDFFLTISHPKKSCIHRCL